MGRGCGNSEKEESNVILQRHLNMFCGIEDIMVKSWTNSPTLFSIIISKTLLLCVMTLLRVRNGSLIVLALDGIISYDTMDTLA